MMNFFARTHEARHIWWLKPQQRSMEEVKRYKFKIKKKANVLQ